MEVAMSPPLLGTGNKDTQRNIKRTKRNTKERRDKKRKESNLEKLNILERKYFPLPTVHSMPSNLSLDECHFEGRKVLKAYQFTPTNLGYLDGLIIFYEDGTTDVFITSVSWEVISKPILKEIRRWRFNESPFQIKDEKDSYALFFSRKGISVTKETKMKYEDAFCLLSKYFDWIYDVKISNDSFSNDSYSSKPLIMVEQFLT